MATLAPAIIDLQHVGRRVDAAGHGQVGLDPAVEDGDPVQAQQQFVRRAQAQGRPDLQQAQVEVRLVEAVEQHQGVGPRLAQPPGERRRGAEERARFSPPAAAGRFSRTARTISTYRSSTAAPLTIGSVGRK